MCGPALLVTAAHGQDNLAHELRTLLVTSRRKRRRQPVISWLAPDGAVRWGRLRHVPVNEDSQRPRAHCKRLLPGLLPRLTACYSSLEKASSA